MPSLAAPSLSVAPPLAEAAGSAWEAPASPAALAEAVARWQSEVWGWALCCCQRDRELARDALQAAYQAVLQGRARYVARAAAHQQPGAAEGALRAWWWGVVRNTARQACRRQQWRRWFVGTPLVEETVATDGAEPSGNDWRPLLVSALHSLPERQREVLHLVFYEGRTLDEAAHCLGLHPGTARQHYERGKARLRTHLQPLLEHEDFRAHLA